MARVTPSPLIPADKNGLRLTSSFFSFGHFFKAFKLVTVIIRKQEGNTVSLFTTGLIVWSCLLLISTAAVNGSLR